MNNGDAWLETTWEGLRHRQHRDYAALPFREKIRRLEEMAEVAAFFAACRRARQAAPAPAAPAQPS